MINEILSQTNVADIINSLSEKSIIVPPWSALNTEYDPTQHEIMTDVVTRKDKIRKDGIEKAARVTYGQQKMFARRMTQFAFSIPVVRDYEHDGSDEAISIEQAIENVYSKCRIDALNIKRMHAYFAACEILTVWYAVKSPNEDYGFKSEFKLRTASYSPMAPKFSRIEHASLYPLFDNGDMIAMSFKYDKVVSRKSIEYFETYTSDKHLRFKRDEGEWTIEIDEPIVLMKIPAIYLWRPLPIWEDTTNNTKEIEYALSRESDILRKNSAPVLAVKGEAEGRNSAQDEPREVYRLKDGGDINYVTWSQQIEAMKYYIETLKRNTEEELQLPNLSLENVKGLGAISGEARKTLLTDAHLKVGFESGDIVEFLDRECNVIKSFLEVMNVKWKGQTAKVRVEHSVTPFIQNDEQAKIDRIMKATGGEQVASRETGVRMLGWVSGDKIDDEIRRIEDEQTARFAPSVFEPTE